jgi:hypothetical protein
MKGALMDREKLVRKLEGMLDSAETDRMWGSIEIEIRDGVPVIIRKASTEKLEEGATGGNNRGRHDYHR